MRRLLVGSLMVLLLGACSTPSGPTVVPNTNSSSAAVPNTSAKPSANATTRATPSAAPTTEIPPTPAYCQNVAEANEIAPDGVQAQDPGTYTALSDLMKSAAANTSDTELKAFFAQLAAFNTKRSANQANATDAAAVLSAGKAASAKIDADCSIDISKLIGNNE